MNNLAFSIPTANVGPSLRDVWAERDRCLKPMLASAMSLKGLYNKASPLSEGRAKAIRGASGAGSFEERLFDNLVTMKVSISTFAMHLSHPERQRLFEALDDTINIDDWHEGDEFPKLESFSQFLKWMIFSKNTDWTSMGVSDSGTILVAWRKPNVLLTADFEDSNNVRWTARLTGEGGEVGHAAGRCPLKLFAEQANFYLKR